MCSAEAGHVLWSSCGSPLADGTRFSRRRHQRCPAITHVRRSQRDSEPGRSRMALGTAAMTTGGLTSRYCPVCNTITQGPFRPGPGGRPDASCPECMSLERQRFLAIVLDGLAPVLNGAELFVDVAPSPQTSKLFQALRPKRYVRVDLDPAADGRQVEVRASLTHLPFAGSSVAAMVCYHVLEHIADDKRGDPRDHTRARPAWPRPRPSAVAPECSDR